MKILFFCLCFSSPALAGQALTLPQNLPDSNAFIGWTEQKGEESSTQAWNSLKPVEAECARPGLFPTHPQMSLKQYHLAFTGTYDHFRLEAGSEACALGGKRKNAQGLYPCFRPDTLVYEVLSDTYQDHCGHFFRGFSQVLFFRRDENMGTLFSPGRGSIPKPGGLFEGEYTEIPTYALKEADFLFLTNLFPGDEAVIERGRQEAFREGFRQDQDSGLFVRP